MLIDSAVLPAVAAAILQEQMPEYMLASVISAIRIV